MNSLKENLKENYSTFNLTTVVLTVSGVGQHYDNKTFSFACVDVKNGTIFILLNPFFLCANVVSKVSAQSA